MKAQGIDAALDGMRHRLHAHGGTVRASSHPGGVVSLNFSGACQGCPALPMTLSAVERELERVEGVTRVDCDQVSISPHARRRLRAVWNDRSAFRCDS